MSHCICAKPLSGVWVQPYLSVPRLLLSEASHPQQCSLSPDTGTCGDPCRPNWIHDISRQPQAASLGCLKIRPHRGWEGSLPNSRLCSAGVKLLPASDPHSRAALRSLLHCPSPGSSASLALSAPPGWATGHSRQYPGLGLSGLNVSPRPNAIPHPAWARATACCLKRLEISQMSL